MKSINFSQNFLHNYQLVDFLIRKSGLTKDDAVIEIGAGSGSITRTLAKQIGKVVAVEKDNRLARHLEEKFNKYQNVEVVHEDFLGFELPNTDYKIFSNPPFNISTEIIKKLLTAKNPPTHTYLVLQKEASLKFAGFGKTTLFSLFYLPYFEFKIIHRFKPTDFKPAPKVAVIFLGIEKRKQSLVEEKHKKTYQDFVTFVFNRSNPNLFFALNQILPVEKITTIQKSLAVDFKKISPSQLHFEQWLELFNESVDFINRKKIGGSYANLIKQQSQLPKTHRTREY
ncbi:MAG: 23S ribosomal RNA methyltransferase Erm [Pseudomonadales bacterium]|jgi:23S rRNA (adenine-N6)-dimethyltransferase|nr:23S ribosomal RNA methyltransferase Erm [Pseudomonadales bacterium]